MAEVTVMKWSGEVPQAPIAVAFFRRLTPPEEVRVVVGLPSALLLFTRSLVLFGVAGFDIRHDFFTSDQNHERICPSTTELMTSISHQPVLPPQVPSSVPQTVAQLPSQSPLTGGTASPQAAVPAAATGRSYANATKKPATNTVAATQAAAGAQHHKTEISGSVNGKSTIPPAVPTLGTPTIVNGNNAMNISTGQGDHNRKSSVTISAQGASGQMPNGGPAAGKPVIGNNIHFGSTSPVIVHSLPQSMHSANSLAVSAPSNPRITSPANSPSPIPQPPASGGRPPSSLQGQSNVPIFGQLEEQSHQLRPGMPSGSLTPGLQATHLRREPSQSAHSEGNTNMGSNGGRGGYPQQASRGRGYGPQYPQHNQQNPNSPNAAFRAIPNQPRSGQSMGQQYQPQGRPLGSPSPHFSHQAARSPAFSNSQPIHSQTGQMAPMPSPGMQHSPYGGYPPQMGPPQVKPLSSSSLHKSPFSSNRSRNKQQAHSPNFLGQIPIPNLAPDSGQFEHYLMTRNQNQYGVPQGYDPYGGGYYSPYMQPGMAYMGTPISPRPAYNMPSTPQTQYVPGQYAAHQQPPSMSRTSSAVSDRLVSGPGQPQTPMTPAASHSVTASRGTNSPAPTSTNFKVPPRKSAGIVIKDPNSGVVKDFHKPLASPAPPAPLSKSPAIVSSTPPPPPRTPSHPDTNNRTESKSVKTDEEKKTDMRDAITRKIEADKEEERRRQEEAAAKALKDKEELEAETQRQRKAKEDQEVEETKAREAEAARVKAAEEAKAEAELEAKAKAEAEAAAAAKEAEFAAEKASTSKIEDDEAEKARKAKEEDEYYVRLEAEMEREEQEREAAYQKKKAAAKEEAARKEAAAVAMADADMKKAEREAEAAEEARIKKLEEEGEDKTARTDLFRELKKEDPITQIVAEPVATETPDESGAATPVSDSASMPPPPRGAAGGKKIPTALKIETKPVEAPQPSAALQSLRSARFLNIIDDATYPAAIQSPNPALNTSAPMGKFRYDKNFLMQFQPVFVEKPSENWSDKVKETIGDTSETPASARSARTGGGMMTSRQTSARGSVLPSGGAFGGGAFASFQGAGARTLPPGTTSESRFQASTQAGPRGTGQNPVRYNPNVVGGFPIGISQSMTRTASSNSLGHPQSPRNTPSQRGAGGRGSNRGKPQRENDKDAKTMPITAGQDLKPIQVSATGWKPRSVGANAAGMAGPPPGGDGYLAPDVVQRKVKAALNKMTPSTFDKISGQLLEIVMQSKKETDGRTLRQVIQLTFEKATDEAHWAQMYAEFCSRMLQNMTPEIKDETLPLDKNGKVNAGGTLFRKYLLNRCQQDFEAGWKSKLPAKPEGEMDQAAMLSDEYYIAAAAKRRGLGLVRFIGELFKLGMLTSRIMHMCVQRLVDWVGMPDEAEVESLTSLLKTIGGTLDSEEKLKSELRMDVYFNRINSMIEVEGLPSRLRFMLMDIVDMRRKGWKTKDSATKGPTTLEEVRQQAMAAEREKDAQRAADSGNRRGGGGGGGGGRMGLGRGDARNFSGGGQNMPPPDYQRNTVGMDDLRRLGNKAGSRQPSSQGAPSFGPTSMFNARGSNTRRTLGPGGGLVPGGDSGVSSRTATPPAQREKKEKEDKEAATSANAFSALLSLDSGETPDHPASPPSNAASPPLTNAIPVNERQRSKSPLGNAQDHEAASNGT
ncbi:hypothetical protein MMC13_001386 [Lambiella insularis]|nr:hypothetical protein [Lambiella insularis]